jgi:hypothetical protein
MDLSELLALVHHEVQKAYDFVHETSRPEDGSSESALHIALESVELEMPVMFSEASVLYEPDKLVEVSDALKRLKVPYQSDQASVSTQVPDRPIKGRAVRVQLIGPKEKLDPKLKRAKIGRVKVVVKPILS